jgi:3-oxoacyl-[acyl-carrier protein] reductase
MSQPIAARLSGKVALVTGASRGIGVAIAERLAAEGAAIAVNYVASEAAAHAVVARIRAAGGTAEAIQGDVSQVATAAPLVAETISRLGRLDILVNNAAVSMGLDLDAITEADFDRMVATNMKSVLFLSQAAARAMAPGSVIINLSSVGTRMATPRFVVYAATKAAVETMTLSMARALAPRRIRVVAVAPGMTDTEMLRRAIPAQILADAAARNPLGRLGQVEDIAPVIAFLTSDDAGWITGETLHVNGGQHG